MIELSHVSKTFGDFRAVNDVSFSIPTGQIVGLLGPNGAGKTTTMRMITGFLEPTEGHILIDGVDIQNAPVESKKKIGYMPESAPLYGDMIVEDYLVYIAKMHGQNPDEKVPQLCDECGLKEVMSKNISELSRGNRQRVALAHALMADPEILILDEPTSGLDPNQVEEVRNIIREIGKTRTVIVSTHILSEVEVICSRAIIISGGKLVADSPIGELKERFGNQESVKLSVGGDFSAVENELKSIEGISSVKKTEDGYVIANITGNKEVRPEIAKKLVESGFELYEMTFQKNSLEDVFHALTTGGSSNE
ncbi:MAG: ABC transporter ATP-binding protein [Treponema sp.]|nr:ABC transporter ATP-binding protein [Spirochaetia bacterium]MDY2838787.1 ABC transporter ATP-binding protein [Treponema sp.]MDY5123316.1 ABC transporter ATP-binding protein [Treponema sp.]